MLKALIEKQFMEIFRTYYINKKTGKLVSKGKLVGKFVGFAVLMIFVGVCFFGMSFTLSGLLDAGLDWLFLALMSVVAVLMGTFGSVFNTYASLYKAKDNELLISMPIPPKTILLSRISGVAGLALLYTGIVWLPTSIFYWIYVTPSVSAIVIDVLLVFVISLFVTVLTCILGWLVALISGKLKNKSFITVIISVIFFGAYYVFCFKMQDILMAMVTNSEAVGNAFQKWGNLFYQIGNAGAGDWGAMLIFTASSVVLTAITFYVLVKTFIKIATTKVSEKKVEYKETGMKQTDHKKALFNRELAHFTSSSTYMLNCGFGILFMPIIPIVVLLKHEQFTAVLAEFNSSPDFASFLVVAAVCVMCLIVSMNCISTPSISLEGKTLWILQSTPANAADVLDAKVNLHVTINAIPACISTAAFVYLVSNDIYSTVVGTVVVWMYIWFTGTVGLIIGLKRPNFTWTTETTPIKQSMNVMFSLLGGWALSIGMGGIYYLISDKLSAQSYLIVLMCVFVLVTRFLKRWLNTKGAEEFMAL